MRVLIADDEPLARDLMRALLSDHTGVELVGEAVDGDQAIAMAKTLHPDLVFLDIDMPHRNGIQAAMDIAPLGSELIFVTAHEEHAIDAFEIGALDYILKPVRRTRFARTMERALRRHAARIEPATAGRAGPARPGEDRALWVAVRGGSVRIALADVVRVEAAGDHVYLHTAERTFMHRITMTELERGLTGTGLLRVHRSAFVRPERVVAVNRRGKAVSLTLDDDTLVPVGTNYRGEVLKRLHTGA